MRETKIKIKDALRRAYGFAPLPKEIHIITIASVDFEEMPGTTIIADINGHFYQIDIYRDGSLAEVRQLSKYAKDRLCRSYNH